MTKLSLRLRLIILFVIISGIFGAMAGVLSWQETKEKIDEFFDTYQIALARQLAAADWSTVSPRIQQATDRLLDNIADADDEDEAIGFAVFDKNGRKVFHDDQNGRDFAYTPVIGSYVEQRVDDENGELSGFIRLTSNMSLPSDKSLTTGRTSPGIWLRSLSALGFSGWRPCC